LEAGKAYKYVKKVGFILYENIKFSGTDTGITKFLPIVFQRLIEFVAVFTFLFFIFSS
jgi:hypothetical protein